MSARRVLVAGIGNVFFGDDGFGVEVVRRVIARGVPDGVRAVDFGIRGIDLAYALSDGFDGAVLIDVVHRGGAPGTLYVIEPTVSPEFGTPESEGHSMTPARVLQWVSAVGGRLPPLRLVGCEPETFGWEDEVPDGLSATVDAAVGPAVDAVFSLVDAMLGREAPHA